MPWLRNFLMHVSCLHLEVTALFITMEKEKVFQDIFKVKAVDTTAAGDTFTGYFIAAVIEGRSIQEALRMAAKASSIAVSRPGATPSIPRADEVKKELGM